MSLDMGVDPNESTWVDSETSSQVESVSFGAVDPPLNLKMKMNFTLSRPQVYVLLTSFESMETLSRYDLYFDT